jgi:peptide/nickel transport system permease protein
MSQVQSGVVGDESTDAQFGMEAVAGRTPRELFWRRFRKDRAALLGVVFIVILVVLALGAPLISRFVAHHGPNELHGQFTNEFGLPALGPSKHFWFGVDKIGRDVFVRTVYGARTSLTVAVVATGLSVVIGIVLGSFGGFLGGWVDTVVSRAMDIVLSLPILLFSIGIAAACSIKATGCLNGLIQPGISLVSAIIALFSWPYIGRIVRGQVLTLREKEFVESARALGAGSGRIMFREILPNVLAPIIVYTTLIIPNNIIFESALSFLGVGIPQTTPSWGQMIYTATSGELYLSAWWMLLFPGMFLVMTTLAFNLLGDGLRDAFDPRMGR